MLFKKGSRLQKATVNRLSVRGQIGATDHCLNGRSNGDTPHHITRLADILKSRDENSFVSCAVAKAIAQDASEPIPARMQPHPRVVGGVCSAVIQHGFRCRSARLLLILREATRSIAPRFTFAGGRPREAPLRLRRLSPIVD